MRDGSASPCGCGCGGGYERENHAGLYEAFRLPPLWPLSLAAAHSATICRRCPLVKHSTVNRAARYSAHTARSRPAALPARGEWEGGGLLRDGGLRRVDERAGAVGDGRRALRPTGKSHRSIVEQHHSTAVFTNGGHSRLRQLIVAHGARSTRYTGRRVRVRRESTTFTRV